MDKPRIEAAVRELLAAIGEDPDREGLVETPRRIAQMCEEIFAGLEEDPHKHLKLFDEHSDDMVTVRDIPLYSVCEHHLLPSLSGWAKRVHAGLAYKHPPTSCTRHLPHVPRPPQSACTR